MTFNNPLAAEIPVDEKTTEARNAAAGAIEPLANAWANRDRSATPDKVLALSIAISLRRIADSLAQS